MSKKPSVEELINAVSQRIRESKKFESRCREALKKDDEDLWITLIKEAAKVVLGMAVNVIESEIVQRIWNWIKDKFR